MGVIVYTLLVAGVVFQLEKKSMDQKEDSNEEGEAESVGRSSNFKVSFDHALIEKVIYFTSSAKDSNINGAQDIKCGKETIENISGQNDEKALEFAKSHLSGSSDDLSVKSPLLWIFHAAFVDPDENVRLFVARKFGEILI